MSFNISEVTISRSLLVSNHQLNQRIKSHKNVSRVSIEARMLRAPVMILFPVTLYPFEAVLASGRGGSCLVVT